MTSWYTEFNAVFWITISTLVCGSVGLVVRYCLKSKCEDINLCYGLLHVKRDVKAEVDLEMKEMDEVKDNDTQ
jgi:hypothetical protein